MIGKAALVCNFDDRPVRGAQELEGLANANLSQIFAERAAHEATEAAGNVHGVNA